MLPRPRLRRLGVVLVAEHDVLMATTLTRAEAREPRHVTASSSATLAFSARSAAVIIPGPFTALVYVVPQPHPHLPAKHDDPIMVGAEIGLVLVVLFVGCRLVAGRLLHPDQ